MVNGTHWHEGCFACIFCVQPINPSVADSVFPWQNEENIYCCKKDYIENFFEKCIACDEAILGPKQKIWGRSYHPKCITCVECNVSAIDPETKQVNGRKIADTKIVQIVQDTEVDAEVDAEAKVENTEVAIESWLVCKQHVAPIELTTECQTKIHQRYVSIARDATLKEERKIKHVQLIENARTCLSITAEKITYKNNKKKELEIKIQTFFKNGGKWQTSDSITNSNDIVDEKGETKDTSIETITDIEELVDDDGNIYFHQISTGITTWHRPV